jgi:hypothetical protein
MKMIIMMILITTSLLYDRFISAVLMITLFGKVTYARHEENCDAITIQKGDWSTNKTDKYQ